MNAPTARPQPATPGAQIPETLRVINLGLPKSGTTTLGAALSAAGMRVADWKIRAGQSKTTRGFVGRLMYDGYYTTGDPLHHLHEFNAFTEIEIVREGKNCWPQTDWALLAAIRAKYPGAKFILSYRDPAKHAGSMRRWSNLGKTRLPDNAVPGLPAGFGAKQGELERWIAGHAAFCRQVFRGADDFLEYDVEDTGARDRIAAFLGLDLPWWGKANANKNHPEGETA